MVSVFSLNGCKTTTTAAETTAAETAAAETAAAETAAAVAGEEETYIFPGGWWETECWQGYQYGGMMAEKFLRSEGQNVKFEVAGPTGDDIDGVFKGLEASVSKNPTGILWYNFNIGEGPLLTEYFKNGGIIASLLSQPTDYPYQFVWGEDPIYCGEMIAKAFLSEMEKIGKKEFKYGIMTISGEVNQQLRYQGMMNIMEAYEGATFIGPPIETTGTEDGANANAAAYVVTHPDIDGILNSGSFGGAGFAKAFEEQGFKPGEKILVVQGSGQAQLEAIEKGWIQAALCSTLQHYGTFYAVITSHIIHKKGINMTLDDAKLNLFAANINTAFPVITKENVENFKTLQYPSDLK